MGSNQSQEQRSTWENNHGITLINSGPNQEQTNQKITLPPRVPPVLSVGGHKIEPKLHKPSEHQLDPAPWVDLATTINKFVLSRGDLVAARQNLLQEKISQLDDNVQKFTDSYVNDRHEALAQMNDDCRQVESMSKTLEKYTIQSELCVDMLNKLNFLLPAENKLEPLEAS